MSFFKEIEKFVDKNTDSITRPNGVTDWLLPVIGGAAGMYFGGPWGATAGAGLGRNIAGWITGESGEDNLKNSIAAAGIGGLSGAALQGAGIGSGATTTGTLTPSATSGAMSLPSVLGTGSGISSIAAPITSESAYASMFPSLAASTTGTLSSAGTAASSLPSVLGSTSGSGLLSTLSNIGGTAKSVLGNPLTQLGTQLATNLYGNYAQAKMAEEMNAAEQEAAEKQQLAQQVAYNQYLANLNPDDATLAANYNAAKAEILNNANVANRALSDELSARGIKGRGQASQFASNSRSTADKLNDAYLQIYGNYNVPTSQLQVSSVPASYYPSTSQLFGINLANTLNAAYPYGTGYNVGGY